VVVLGLDRRHGGRFCSGFVFELREGKGAHHAGVSNAASEIVLTNNLLEAALALEFADLKKVVLVPRVSGAEEDALWNGEEEGPASHVLL
jgi:hypothetical protein